MYPYKEKILFGLKDENDDVCFFFAYIALDRKWHLYLIGEKPNYRMWLLDNLHSKLQWSADLNQGDYWSWGYAENLLFSTSPTTLEELRIIWEQIGAIYPAILDNAGYKL